MAAPFPANIPPADATAFLRDKLAIPTETWTDIWKEAHARAFVVAGANTEAIVTDFHQAVTRAIAEGQTLEQFRQSFDAIVEKHGWSHTGSRGWRSRVIFETNTRMAYMAAKWKGFVENKLMRPFLRYVGILDDRIRPQHRSWHDTVLPVDDPWWQTHFPPNGWGCRCDVQSLSQRDLDRRGFRVQPEAPPMVMVSRPVNSATGRTSVMVPKGIDPGFDYNVGVAAYGTGLAKPLPRDGKQWPKLLGPFQGKDPVTGLEPKLPDLPLEKPVAELLPRATPNFPDILASIIDMVIDNASGSITDVVETSILIGGRMLEHLGGKDSRADGRHRYLPLLPELLRDPAEIWVGFAADPDTGKVTMRRRYVKYLDLPESGVRAVGLVAEAAAREWVGFTMFRGDEDLFKNMRWGHLLYRSPRVK